MARPPARRHPTRAVAAWLWDHLTHRKPPPPRTRLMRALPPPPPPARPSSLAPRYETQFTHRDPPTTP